MVKQLKLYDCLFIKFESKSIKNLPDRICLFSDGTVSFVELKAPRKKPRKSQHIVFKHLDSMGFEVVVIDTNKGVDEWIISKSHTKNKPLKKL